MCASRTRQAVRVLHDSCDAGHVGDEEQRRTLEGTGVVASTCMPSDANSRAHDLVDPCARRRASAHEGAQVRTKARKCARRSTKARKCHGSIFVSLTARDALRASYSSSARNDVTFRVRVMASYSESV